MRVVEEIQSNITEISSIETLLVASIRNQIKPETVLPEELRNSILEHNPVNKLQELLQLLLQFPAVLKTSTRSYLQLAHDDCAVANHKPLF